MEINRYFKFHLYGFLADDINFAPNHVYFEKLIILEDLIQEAKKKFNISTTSPLLIYFLNDSGYLILIKNKFQIVELLAPSSNSSGTEKQMVTFVLKPEIGVFVCLVLDNRDSIFIDYQTKKIGERLVVLDTELSWTNLLQTLAEIIGISHNSTHCIGAITDITRMIRYTSSQSIRSGDTLVLHILNKYSNIPVNAPIDNNSQPVHSDVKKFLFPSPNDSQHHLHPFNNRSDAKAIALEPALVPTSHQISPVNNLKRQSHSPNQPQNSPPSPTKSPIIIKQSPPNSPTFIYTSQLHQAIYHAFLQLDLTLTKDGLNFLLDMCNSEDDAVDFYYERGQDFFLRKNYIISHDNIDQPVDQKNHSNTNILYESVNNKIIKSIAPKEGEWRKVRSHKSQTKVKSSETESSTTIPSSLSSLGSPLQTDNSRSHNNSVRDTSSPSTLSRSKSTSYSTVDAEIKESRAPPGGGGGGRKKSELHKRSASVSSITADYQDKLLSMGYSLPRINEAFLRCSSLEAAIDYLGSQEEHEVVVGEGKKENLEVVATKDQQAVGVDGGSVEKISDKLNNNNNSNIQSLQTEAMKNASLAVVESPPATPLVCLDCVSGQRMNPPTQCILSGCLLNHSYCCYHYLIYFNQTYLKKSSRLLPCCMYAGTETDDSHCGYTMSAKNVQDILKTLQLYCDVETVIKLKSVLNLLYRIEGHRQKAEFWCTRCAQGEEEPLNWYSSQTDLKSYSDEQCWFTIPIDANRQCPRCPRCLVDYCGLCGISPFHHGSKCETLFPLTLFWRDWLTTQKALRLLSEKRYNALFSGATSRMHMMEDVHSKRCQPDKYRQCPTCQRVKKKTTQSDITICGMTIEADGGHVKVLDGCGTTFDWLSSRPLNPKRSTNVTLPGYDSKLSPSQLQRVNHKIMCTICKNKIIGNRLDCVFCLNVTLCSFCCLDPSRKICPDNHIFKVINKPSDEYSPIHKTNE